jgi:hypothetical protein
MPGARYSGHHNPYRTNRPSEIPSDCFQASRTDRRSVACAEDARVALRVCRRGTQTLASHVDPLKKFKQLHVTIPNIVLTFEAGSSELILSNHTR